MSVEHILFPLLRAGLYGEIVDAKIADSIDTATLQKLYTVSNAHDIAHIVGVALAKCGKLGDDDCSKNFRGKALLAMSRYERIRYDLQTICEALEQAGIPFIPLKGSVLRTYYSEPWMRTSCDIDVLVKNEDLERAAQVLRNDLGYDQKRKEEHDISFYSHSGIHIELHFNLIEDNWANWASEILQDVWCAVSKENCKFHYVLSDEMFYFYHVAHMTKHFEQGGCGIRPFIDLWILDNMEGAGHSRRDALLEKGNLLKFTHAARRLVKVWFEGAPYDPITRQMQEYVFRGGVYGAMSNQIITIQKRMGGKWQYALSRIWMPYNEISQAYPILLKHPWLTPLIQVYRWFRILFEGRTETAVKELSYSQSISKEQLQEFKEFFKELGL